MSGADRHLLAVQTFDDLGSQDGLQLLDIGMGAPQIAIDITTAANDFNLLSLHSSNSFRLFKGLSISSISCFGIVMPFVDFLWNAWRTQISRAIWTA